MKAHVFIIIWQVGWVWFLVGTIIVIDIKLATTPVVLLLVVVVLFIINSFGVGQI
jgi:hypothetical protein